MLPAFVLHTNAGFHLELFAFCLNKRDIDGDQRMEV